MVAKNNGLDNELFESILETNKTTNFHQLLDMNIVELGIGSSVLEVLISEKHLNPIGIAHGGVMFSIMDASMGMAARTIGKDVVSLEMNINFIAPVNESDTIKTYSKILHAGQKTTVATCEAYNQKNELIATARETFYNMK